MPDIINDAKSVAELLFDKNHQLFLNFQEHTNQKQNSALYLMNELNEWIKNLVLLNNFSYLDVGCGFGDLTLSIIKTIQKYSAVNSVALDPSQQLLAMFKENINEQVIDLICSTWETYQPTQRFHFISSIHTFYYVDDWQTTISKMLSTLDDHGQICIALRSNDPVCQFRNYFYKKIHHNEKRERSCDELCLLLDKLGIKYKLNYVNSTLDVRDCILRNEKGKKLLEFILRQPYANLEALHDEIISYFKHIEENGHLTQRDGYVWIKKQSGENQ